MMNKPMKRNLFIFGAIAIAFVFGALTVALTQALPFTQTASADEGEAEPGIVKEMVIVIEEIKNGAVTAGTVRVQFEEADGLPAGSADQSGLYVSQDGNSLLLGTGSIEVGVDVEVEDGGEPVTTVVAKYDGPEVTVTFDDETLFFTDTTIRPEVTSDDIEVGTIAVKQTIGSGVAADMGDNMMIRAWGEMIDGILHADVIVYEKIQ